MRILQVNNFFYIKGGTDRVFFNTIELLESHSHSVIPFSTKSSLNSFSEYEKYFVTIKNYNTKKNTQLKYFNNFYSWDAANKLEKMIKNFRPEVAHLHNINGLITFSILPVLKKFNIPIISTIHGFKYLCPAYVFINGKGEICEDCKVGKYYKCTINNCSIEGLHKSIILSVDSYLRDFIFPYDKLIDKFIFVSEFTMNKFIEYKPNIRSKSYKLYNFIKEFGLSKKRGKEKYFLFAGRLDREKGLYTLINTFKKLPGEKLLIAGDGHLRKEIELNKPTNVEIVGYKSGKELKELVGNSYFVILPSECYENNPMIIIEANSLGVPVIGSDLGGIPEIIKDGETGFLFEAKSENSLEKAVVKSAQMNEKSYSRFSSASYKFAMENFNKEKHYESLISIYEQALRETNYKPF